MNWSEMILRLLLIFPFVYSTKNSENDLLSLETGYHQKATHDPMPNYYSPAVHYNNYEQPPQLEYIPHPYTAHETPKVKKMSYPMSDSPHMKPYSSPSPYPSSSYGYGPPPPKPYDSYKPKKYSTSYALPIYQSEHMKYKPNKKIYKVSHPAPDPHPPSVMYPIDDYYQYKPEPYSYPPSKQTYTYPYQPEYQSYSTSKAYPPQTYSDYPKQSYNYSPPPPSPSSHYSYEPKPDYPKTTYDDEPYYSSNNYPLKY